MDMEPKKETPVPPQGDRISQGTAAEPAIVPDRPRSTSCDGLDTALTASVVSENVIAESSKAQVDASTADFPSEETAVKKKEASVKEDKLHALEKDVIKGSPATNASFFKLVKKKTPKQDESEMDSDDTDEAASLKSIKSMDCDELRASKRKMLYTSDSEDEDEILRTNKVSRKCRAFPDSDDKPLPQRGIRRGVSSTDRTSTPVSEEEMKDKERTRESTEDKQDRILTRNKKKELQKKKEEEERNRQKEKEKKEMEKIKKEEEKKAEKIAEKEVKKQIAESKIMSKMDTKNIIDREVMNAMSASDVAAMALEYLEGMDTIRAKCGTMQGALSGELKRRKSSLDDMIRALHYKAEQQGDPQYLRARIDELLKKHRQEDERKTREISELRESVVILTKENKNMRRELREIKLSIERRSPSLVRRYSPERLRNERDFLQERQSPVKRYTDYDTKYDDTYLSRMKSHEVLLEDVEIPRRIQRLDEAEYPALRTSHDDRRNPVQHLKKEEEIISKVERETRPDIRVLDNRQLVPPREMEELMEIEMIGKSQEEENLEWNSQEESDRNEDREKKDKGKEMNKESRTRNKESRTQNKKTEKMSKTKQVLQRVSRKMPKTAAISIKVDPKRSEGFSYAEVLRKARTNINIGELNISPRLRKGLNGSVIIEIAGPECHEKAEKLTNRLQDVLKEDNVDIRRPSLKGELRISGFDESVTKDDICLVIAEEGKCTIAEVRVGEIRTTRNGLGSVWAKCPLKSALEVAKKAKIKVGWTIAEVSLLKTRPLQCFRCWHQGHVKDQCKSTVDRRDLCYKCGKKGHKLNQCKNEDSCVICKDLGRDHNHRVGSIKCEGVKPKPLIEKDNTKKKKPSTPEDVTEEVPHQQQQE